MKKKKKKPDTGGVLVLPYFSFVQDFVSIILQEIINDYVGKIIISESFFQEFSYRDIFE